MRIAATIVNIVLWAAYPIAIFFMVGRFSSRQIGLVAILILVPLLFLRLRGASKETQIVVLRIPLSVLACLLVATFFDEERILLLVPALISSVLWLQFVFSLRTTPMIERFARLHDANLTDDQQMHCRIFTIGWCVFFAFNAAFTIYLAVSHRVDLWAYYTGAGSYTLMFLLFAAEYVTRRVRFKEFNRLIPDRLLARLIGYRYPHAVSGPEPFKACAIIPTYNNPMTIERVAAHAASFCDQVFVIDDGGDETARTVLARLESTPKIEVITRPVNGGKGAAVKTGLQTARDASFSHAVQVDADGQHTLDDIGRFLDISRRYPNALILGAPRYDDSAPQVRKVARKLTNFWIDRAAGGHVIEDPMCGLRVYPVEKAASLTVPGNRMEFDPEIAVRLVWQDVPVVNIPTRVRYLTQAEGGVSHFRAFEDNARIAWLHTRLMFERCVRLVVGKGFLPARRIEVDDRTNHQSRADVSIQEPAN